MFVRVFNSVGIERVKMILVQVSETLQGCTNSSWHDVCISYAGVIYSVFSWSELFETNIYNNRLFLYTYLVLCHPYTYPVHK